MPADALTNGGTSEQVYRRFSRLTPHICTAPPESRKMLLLIDNYDSFTFNLVHFLGESGAECDVRRNDALNVQEAMALRPEGIILSPGPCDPLHPL